MNNYDSHISEEPPIISTHDDVEYYKKTCYEYKVIPRKAFINQINEKHIDLKDFMISSNEMTVIFKTLKNITTLESVDVSNNFMAIDACCIFEDFFCINRSLICINLTACRIGPNGLKYLVNGLIDNPTLKELILASNFITDEGIEILTPIILNNPIKKYNLSRNMLTYKSGKMLAKIINVNSEIEEIDLSWNAIDSINGMIPLLRGLLKNKSITKLNISWNGLVGFEIESVLKRLMKFNKVLKHLDISNNRLGSAVVGMSSVKNVQ